MTNRMPRLARLLAVLGLAAAAGSCTTQFEAEPSIPEPLIEKIPLVIGVYLSPEFRTKVYAEERDGGDYSISIGKAQTDGFMRLMSALFEQAIPVDAVDAAARTDPRIRGVIEPVLEDFAFVTPYDSGTDAYAVSLRYKVTGYRADGQVVDSWTFTGYGAAKNEGMLPSGEEALRTAVRLAMRDAGAKLATELRDQAVVRGLLPASDAAPAPAEVTPPP
ncbi:MAG: hypothetical protein U1F08_01645 [Steroidobacteraceae bacterium]